MNTALAVAEASLMPIDRPAADIVTDEMIHADDARQLEDLVQLWCPELGANNRAGLLASVEQVVLAARANARHRIADRLDALLELPETVPGLRPGHRYPIQFRLARRSGLLRAITYFIRWA